MSQEEAVSLSGFAGLNIREPIGMIDDRQLSVCENYNIGRAGELSKRTGFALSNSGSLMTAGSAAVQLLGFFKTDTLAQMLAASGTYFYRSSDNGATWTGSSGTLRTWGVQYANNFYLINSNGVIEKWDGTSLTNLAGSPSGTFGIIYRDRLFVLNTGASGTLSSRLYYSAPGDLTSWPSINFIDVAVGDGDILIGAAVLQDLLVLFKTKSTWILYADGQPTDWTLRNSSPALGCMSKFTIKEIEGMLYFQGVSGVYRTDGNTYQAISDDIQPAFATQFIDASTINLSTAAWYDDKYILLLRSIPVVTTWASWATKTWADLATTTWGGTNIVYEIYVYHLKIGSWTKWSVASTYTFFNFLELTSASIAKGLYIGDRGTTGKLFKYGPVVYQDDAANYTATFQTKEYHFGSPSKLKRGKWLLLDQQGGGSHTFYNVVNGSTQTAQNLTMIVDRGHFKLSGPGYFRTWRLRGEANHSAPDVFYGVVLHMHRKRTVVGNSN